MTKPTGFPRGHVPRSRQFVDNSHLFGSHGAERRRLERAASDAEWVGDHETAAFCRAQAEYHRQQGAEHGDLLPLF